MKAIEAGSGKKKKIRKPNLGELLPVEHVMATHIELGHMNPYNRQTDIAAIKNKIAVKGEILDAKSIQEDFQLEHPFEGSTAVPIKKLVGNLFNGANYIRKRDTKRIPGINWPFGLDAQVTYYIKNVPDNEKIDLVILNLPAFFNIPFSLNNSGLTKTDFWNEMNAKPGSFTMQILFNNYWDAEKTYGMLIPLTVYDSRLEKPADLLYPRTGQVLGITYHASGWIKTQNFNILDRDRSWAKGLRTAIHAYEKEIKGKND